MEKQALLQEKENLEKLYAELQAKEKLLEDQLSNNKVVKSEEPSSHSVIHIL
jgi:transcription elongation GreA/GreB family factor